jgi:hypothetical protein
MKQPYKYWTLTDLCEMLIRQADNKGFNPIEIGRMVFDNRWNPITDFDGCTLVSDHLQPFLPCFIHDYRWAVEGGGKHTDIEFRENLLKFGFPKWKANVYYIAVRIAWITYYKKKKRCTELK